MIGESEIGPTDDPLLQTGDGPELVISPELRQLVDAADAALGGLLNYQIKDSDESSYLRWKWQIIAENAQSSIGEIQNGEGEGLDHPEEIG